MPERVLQSNVCPVCGLELLPGEVACSRCQAQGRTSQIEPTITLQLASQVAPAEQEPAQNRFASGHRLGERFRILAPLGSGGMGEVFQAEDVSLQQLVALKFLPPSLTEDRSRMARLRNEVKLARQVAHPNVCRVYDLAEADGLHFLTMEYINGSDLATLLRRAGSLPKDRAIEIFRQLCLGLGAIHDRWILHRDLKPRNIMLDRSGQVRITDFGLAAHAELLHPDELSDGTPAYQAPEQRAGRQVSERSDLFALGLIMVEVVTGNRPAPPNHAQELRSILQENPTSDVAVRFAALGPGVQQVIARCLEPNPQDRPASAYEVLAELPEATLDGSMHSSLNAAREAVARHRLETAQNDAIWSAYLASWDRLLMEFPPYRQLVDDLVAVVPPGPHDVVDLGAGSGSFSAALLAAGQRVTAVEPEPSMFAQLQFLARKLRGMSFTVVQGSIEDLAALQDEAFDAAIIGLAIFLTADPLACLRGVRRILKPGGWLAYATTHRDVSLDPLLGSLKQWLESTGQAEARAADYQLLYDVNKRIEDFAKRFSASQYREWTREAGFEIIRDVPSTYEGAVMLIHARKI